MGRNPEGNGVGPGHAAARLPSFVLLLLLLLGRAAGRGEPANPRGLAARCRPAERPEEGGGAGAR